MLRRLRQIADGVISGVNRSCAMGEPKKYIMRAAFPDRPTLLITNLKTAKRPYEGGGLCHGREGGFSGK